MGLTFEYATSVEGVAFVLRWCRANGSAVSAVLVESKTYAYFQTNPLVEMESHVPVLRLGCMAYIEDTRIYVVRGVPHGEVWLYDVPVTKDLTSKMIFEDFAPVAKISKSRGVFYDRDRA